MTKYPGKPGARPYNGFDPAERAKAWPAIRAAVARGELSLPYQCSICEITFPEPIVFHSEDYSSIDGIYPICRSCHAVLHLRFWRPDRWLAHIGCLNPHGWFQQLLLDPATLSRSFSESYPNGLSAVVRKNSRI